MSKKTIINRRPKWPKQHVWTRAFSEFWMATGWLLNIFWIAYHHFCLALDGFKMPCDHFCLASLLGRDTWNKKKSQGFSRVLWERPHPELQKEPPLDRSELKLQIPFMASLWIRSGEWLAIKGFRCVSSDPSSGGSFRSSQWGRSRGSAEIFWDFFFISSLLAGLCVAFNVRSKTIHWRVFARFQKGKQ